MTDDRGNGGHVRPVIPRPLRVRRDGPGSELRADTGIHTDPAFLPVAEWLRAALARASGWPLAVRVSAEAPSRAVAGIALRRDPRSRDALGLEGYRLDSDARGVIITAAGEAGAFYGAQTLRLLLPPAALRDAPVRDDPVWRVPGTHITDRPRFAWRGALIDVARHFMPVPWLKRLVDLLALHKLNVLHLHLTDDQGWRIQIERYPRLIEVGAWRRESMVGHPGENRYDGVPHGGFYTKDDLRELVAYAAARHIVVMPEIDMPGHTAAAIAAYPELGNGITTPQVRTAWGISDDVLNVEESTVRFFTDVLDEVLEVFPSPHVHVGGDECPTTQ
jgi:hexosaminidase